MKWITWKWLMEDVFHAKVYLSFMICDQERSSTHDLEAKTFISWHMSCFWNFTIFGPVTDILQTCQQHLQLSAFLPYCVTYDPKFSPNHISFVSFSNFLCCPWLTCSNFTCSYKCFFLFKALFDAICLTTDEPSRLLSLIFIMNVALNFLEFLFHDSESIETILLDLIFWDHNRIIDDNPSH